MAAITKIELWKDVGFIDGAVEIPNLSAADPVNPDFTIEPTYPIIPSKERMFSEFKLKEYFSELMTCSYMRITYLIKNSLGIDTPKIFYGWITDVVLTSDAELPVTTISWHIDEWRTWKSAVTFGSGHIKRRPFVDLDSTPIQNYGYRYLHKGTAQTDIDPLCDIYFVYSGNPPQQESMIWWIIFSYNKTTSTNPPETSIEYGAIPVLINMNEDQLGSYLSYLNVYFKATNDQTVYQALSIRSVLKGLFDEKYGIAPSAINGVWLSPELFSNSIIHGSGGQGNPLSLDIPSSLIQPSTKDSNFAYVVLRDREYILEHSTDYLFSSTNKSSETEYLVVTDFEGAKVLDLPYGMDVHQYDKYLMIEPDSAYMVFSFKDGLYGRTEGTTATIPLPQLPVNENAFSEYSYSGQLDYDREMRTVQSNANAWKSSASGAGSGAMMGAFGPQGLLLGVAGGVAGGLISYGVERLYQNDEEQGLMERLKANQIPGLLMGSNVLAATHTRFGPAVIRIYPDDYSLGQIANTRAQFGVSVDELSPSVDTLIRTSSPTGYYNIQNLIVSGDIPVSAKRWIRNKFASGVRLI